MHKEKGIFLKKNSFSQKHKEFVTAKATGAILKSHKLHISLLGNLFVLFLELVSTVLLLKLINRKKYITYKY